MFGYMVLLVVLALGFAVTCLAFELTFFNALYVRAGRKHPELYVRKLCFDEHNEMYYKYKRITFSSGLEYFSADLQDYWVCGKTFEFRKLGFFEARKLYKSQERNQELLENLFKRGYSSAIV